MNYYIDPKWIYWMNVLDSLKILLMVIGIAALVILGVIGIGLATDGYFDDDEDSKKVLKKLIGGACVSICLLFASIFIPSRNTCIEMMVASVVNRENVSSAKEDILELIDHTIDKIKEEN